jgi:Holliday junction resolvase-like predicted endonuclease
MKEPDDIIKSTRHQKIIGQFGEQIVCNWLSRCGFEVAIVDHTGLDIIAYRPETKERLGITVKARTRRVGTESESVNLFSSRHEDRKKLVAACDAFGCHPWIGVYVEAADEADMYLTSLAHYDEEYRGAQGRQVEDWKMSEDHRNRYTQDAQVRHLHVTFDRTGWKWK